MKIAVLGTSNSVMKKGYLNEMQSHKDLNITSYCSGRNPIFFHIKQLLLNINEIKKCDCLIIENYVNDVNYYLPKYSEAGLDYWYIEHVKVFYSLLSLLNKPVLNLMFPIYNIGYRASRYLQLKELAKNFGHSVLDLNNVGFGWGAYQDDVHLKPHISAYLSRTIIECCSKVVDDFKYSNSDIFDLTKIPYLVVPANAVDGVEEENIETFENTLLKFNYLRLEEHWYEYKIPQRFHGSKLLSLGYYNPKDKPHGIKIKGNEYASYDVYGLVGKGYYHESLQQPIPVEASFFISGYTSSDEQVKHDILMSRGHCNSINDVGFVVDFLLYNEELFGEYKLTLTNQVNVDNAFEFDTIPISENLLKVDLLTPEIPLQERFSRLNDSVKKNHKANVIRDLALSFEDMGDIHTAYRLMYQASLLRPDGPFISYKLELYKGKITECL
ncbi:hypothetical protein [Cobetia sp. 5-11-6-3]|uniref:hypothetical protein n=1 Tax=Cobetia sp. 5-11-6-3 TaxID=2737458 RepID=UPI0015969389|nr:hypothetical protein [Cobetia sp. 5-11-6-3]